MLLNLFLTMKELQSEILIKRFLIKTLALFRGVYWNKVLLCFNDFLWLKIYLILFFVDFLL